MRTGIVPALLLCFGTQLVHAQAGPFAAVATNTFADLLRIRVNPPEAFVALRSTTTEDGIQVEDISWKAADGQEVPAFVMRPAGAQGRLPAIVCLHGSTGSRESMSTKQFGVGDWTHPIRKTTAPRLLGWARELARQGYVTLAMTQRGLDVRTRSTEEQTKEMLLYGRPLMGAIVDEIRQAVSDLGERHDVDPKRIGMTGLSFGGITTFYTWFVDPRIAAAAPVCGGIGSLKIFLDQGSRGYHGIYWWIPGMLEKGDQGEFTAAMAPRPLMVWAPTEDIGMPKAGVDRFVQVAAPAYAQAGAKEALVVHQRPGVHTFSMEAFDAVKQFLATHLQQN
jgi:dienelactone hydrolase